MTTERNIREKANRRGYTLSKHKYFKTNPYSERHLYWLKKDDTLLLGMVPLNEIEEFIDKQPTRADFLRYQRQTFGQ